jgi:uncharacterized SAM-binding protein YcdF (DUF218 family)
MDLTLGATRSKTKFRSGYFLAFLGVLLLLASSTCVVLTLGVGRWLVGEDALQQATAMTVHSGNIPTRALEAADLYHEGYAKEIWLTHPDVHDTALKALGISYASEDAFDFRVLRREGVPAKAIHALEHPIVNTAEELEVMSSELASRGDGKVIIVTNKAHTRRAHILWSKYFSSRGQAIARHSRRRLRCDSLVDRPGKHDPDYP